MVNNKLVLDLPHGFRFTPTDEELVRHYLIRKCESQTITTPVIADVDLYKFDPWQLPEMAAYGEKEWYFFTPRNRKYPGGSRPDWAARSGYWKATGLDKLIGSPKNPSAIKKSLVYYIGKAPGGEKTDWIMHEYRLANVDRSAGRNKNLRLDDWVLCRIYHKKGKIGKPFMNPNNPKTQIEDHLEPLGSMARLNTNLSVSGLTSSSDLTGERGVVQSEARPIWDELDLDMDFEIPDDFFGTSIQSPCDDIFGPKDF